MTPFPSVFPFVLCPGIGTFYRVYVRIFCLAHSEVRTCLLSLVYLIRLVLCSHSFQHLQACEVSWGPGDNSGLQVIE